MVVEPSLFCERLSGWNSPYINHFLSPDTIIPDQTNPQSWNRYSYVTNNPLRYADPTGHSRVEGCTELAGGCNITQQTIDDDLRKSNEFRQKTERNQCRGGNKLHCSYAENHPIETAAFIGGGLLFTGIGSAVLSTTAVTAEATITTSTTIEAANTACGNDFCASEADDARQIIDRMIAHGGEPIGDLINRATYRLEGGLNGAFNTFGKLLRTPIVQEAGKKGGGVFIGETPLGGNIIFRATSSFPSTPVLELHNVPGYVQFLKFHYP